MTISIYQKEKFLGFLQRVSWGKSGLDNIMTPDRDMMLEGAFNIYIEDEDILLTGCKTDFIWCSAFKGVPFQYKKVIGNEL